jgi:phosphoglycerate dehydrogenase-like enzyme
MVESYPLVEPTRGAALDHVKIVSRGGLPDFAKERIQGLSNHIEVKFCETEQEIHLHVANAHIIYGGFSREDLAAAKEIRWIQYPAAGVEGLLWPELVESSVVLTNMQRIYAPAISETVLALVLTLTRGIRLYAVQTREHQWKATQGLTEISELTMGIVGLGAVGTETAIRGRTTFRVLAT